MRPIADANEQDIISRAKGGDMNAFEFLVRKYQRLIYALCHRITGAHQAADDLAQDTFIRAYQALPSFIDGREFNLAVIGGREGLEILPPSEILFVDYPDGKPKIVDYRAKWLEESFEYQHTPRTFDFRPEDGPAVERMRELAAECWRTFGLRGYARVDFRLDGAGQPWIMEVNANPCINPDSGFVATADRAGLDYTSLVRRIILDTLPEAVFNP